MKIAEKQEVLGGRGSVVTYANGKGSKGFFYRELVAGTKRYRQKKIEGADSMSQAVEMAMDIALELREEEPHHLAANSIRTVKEPANESLSILEREEKLTRRKERLVREERKKEQPKMTTEKALDDWLAGQKKRVDTGTFEENSYLAKYHAALHLKSYLKYKKIFFTSQISTGTFDEYIEFRFQKTQRRIVIHRELAVIGEWIKSYLVRFKYIPAHLWLDGQFLPRIEVRQIDKDANPAINSDDWKVILDYTRDVWRKEAYDTQDYYQKGVLKGKRQPEKKTVWFREMFWHWILVAKKTGMSPEEICKLKWKNVEIRDVGRYSQSKAEQEIYDLEQEGIEVIPSLHDPKSGDWIADPSHIGREERLIAYISTIRKKTSQPREIPCNLGTEFKRWMTFLKTSGYVIRGDDYVFAQVHNEMKQPSQARIRQAWRKIVDGLMLEGKLKGHKFSDRKYTLYSMRSTFIEDHLLKGTDIFLLARVSGHSVKTLMDTYERMDIRERAKELTDIDYGKRKNVPQIINLFEE